LNKDGLAEVGDECPPLRDQVRAISICHRQPNVDIAERIPLAASQRASQPGRVDTWIRAEQMFQPK
jgi:hypothetical protein